MSEAAELVQKASKLRLSFETVQRSGKMMSGIINSVKQSTDLLQQFDDSLLRISASYKQNKLSSDNYLKDFGQKYSIQNSKETELLANKLRVISNKEKAVFELKQQKIGNIIDLT